MTEKQDPIQAQLIAARRNQILDAATKIFAAKGFERATIRQIATEAGIADGTIYIYFKNKTELLLGILHRINQSEQRSGDFAKATAGDFHAFSATYFRQRLAVMTEHRQALQAILQEMLGNEELRQQYYAEVIAPTYAAAAPFFQKLVDEGVIRPFDSALSMRIIPGAMLGLLLLRMLGDPVVDQQWDQLPEVLFEILYRGLETPAQRGEQ